ncbi:pyridoxamine 5'-phosphate oxidase family protein [Desulfobacula sp.]
MRRNEKEVTNTKDIEKILMDNKVCRLAMVDENKPYMVPMNFGYSNGCLFFHCAKQGRKIELIKKNPNICFEVDQLVKLNKAKLACDWGAEFKSVIGSGRAQFLEDSKEKKAALNIIMSHYSERVFEYPDAMLEKIIVIKVAIHEMTGKQS